MPAFPTPTHPGHTFLGYRGVSKAHFYTEQNKAIKYTPPPPAVVGAAQLGAGVYVASSVRDALGYAQDSGWNLYCSKSKGRDVDNAGARTTFEQEHWMQWGRLHAVFIPTAKFESAKGSIANFSHMNIDRTPFALANIRNAIARDPVPTWALTTEYGEVGGGKTQTVIYPPHSAAVYVKDITEEVAAWDKLN